MTPINCRDCKHCRVARPTNSSLDVCRIAPAVGFYALTERALRFTGCGPDARNFEAKARPWWAFWRRA